MFRYIKKIAVVVLFVIMIITSIYFTTHPTHYKYCDLWILGKHIDEVQERYGEVDYWAGTRAGYQIYSDYYYHMILDEDGVVCDVYEWGAWGG